MPFRSTPRRSTPSPGRATRSATARRTPPRTTPVSSRVRRATVEASPYFDVCLLGVGPDGHVASLFPGRPELDVTDATTLAVHDSPKPPPDRVTMTFPVLNRSREVWFLVSGADKATATARGIRGDDLTRTPAAHVHGVERTLWLIDEDAAADLDA